MSSCKELRARGRETLGNTLFQVKWLFPLLACLIINTISSVSSEFFLLGVIISGALNVGLASYFLMITRIHNTEKGLKTIFSGFTNNLGRNITAGLFYMIIWGILVFFAVLCLVTVKFIIPLFLLPIPVYALVRFMLKYAMLFYVLADNPDYNVWQALSEASALMKGQKWKFFKLQLSFIGWAFVSFITFGVGALWLAPYIQATNVAFYEELKESNEYYVL